MKLFNRKPKDKIKVATAFTLKGLTKQVVQLEQKGFIKQGEVQSAMFDGTPMAYKQAIIKSAKTKYKNRSNWMMKDEFTYYTVSWILEKEIKSRKFYDKKEALKWNELLPEEQRYEVKKHTEIIEVIA